MDIVTVSDDGRKAFACPLSPDCRPIEGAIPLIVHLSRVHEATGVVIRLERPREVRVNGVVLPLERVVTGSLDGKDCSSATARVQEMSAALADQAVTERANALALGMALGELWRVGR